MKDFFKNYGGVIAGAVYALILRLVFNIHELNEIFSLFSVTFIWITPVVIGLIPFVYATNEQINNWLFRIFRPVGTVLVFFIVCFITRIENLICLLVISLPFILGALTCGLILGAIIKRIRIKKGTFYSMLILPYIVCPIEQQFEKPVDIYAVTTHVIIDADSKEIWNNIIRVKEIEINEYSKGLFNYAGIPKPLYAELDKDTLGATRIGHFEGGLKFIEKVNQWEKFKYIGFDIKVVPSSIRQTVFDQHILMGNHFKFISAEYKLKPVDSKMTELILRSSYQLNTNINSYASFCGNQLLMDFQERLLKVIKTRCEK